MVLNKVYNLLVFLTVVSVAPVAQGQSRDWRVYSSADDHFTVEVPADRRIIKTSESKNEATLGLDQRESLPSYFSAYQDASAPNELSKFLIVVINGRAGIFKSLSRSSPVRYLSVMLIGDDDDPYPTRIRASRVNGLEGKEYVWAKKAKVLENGSTNEIFKRGRIFDRGDEIYVIVFIGENSDELRSPTAERFLNSLRLQKQKR